MLSTTTSPYLAAQIGHTTAVFTQEVYARAWDDETGEPERLRALVEGRELGLMRTPAPELAREAG